MRDALKNVFGKEIILEDGTNFFYTIQPCEVKNALGAVVAVLNEYSFTKQGESNSTKLYRTTDGNWYDLQQAGTNISKEDIHRIKIAFDKTFRVQSPL